MNREHIDRLLALYATDSLTDAERKELYAAALQDQALFDQLAEEDSIRELVAMPGAKARLMASLEDEAPAVVAAPSRWFAWASGLALVFVSGAISYLWLERPSAPQETALVRSDREPPKPFAPPAPQAVKAPARVVVDAPPPLAAPKADLPAPIVAPLSAALPPPPPAEVRERRAANEAPAPAGPMREVALARPESDSGAKAKVVEQVVATAELEKARSGFRAAAPAAAAPAPKPSNSADMIAKKEAQSQLSAWRRTGDGVWTRVPGDLAIERDSTVAVRYTPAVNGLYSLTNAAGSSLMSLTGRAGIELEFVLPQSVLANAQGDALRLGIAPARLGAVGGAISTSMRDEAKRQAQPGESITIKLK